MGRNTLNSTKGFAQVNGTRLYYELAGTGHPIVFIHGFAQDTQVWDSQFTWFAHHCQVLRYDLRGFGKSDLPTADTYSHIDDLRALMDTLGIERATILGMSMGGAIAINFALTYPQQTCGLILVASTLEGYELSPETTSLWSSIAALARETSIEAAKWCCLADPLYVRTRQRTKVARRLKEIIFRYSGWHWCNSDPYRMLIPPATGSLDKIVSPTLVLVGEYDIPDILLISKILHSTIPAASRVVLPDAGHVANMEIPRTFNQTVMDFLQSLCRPMAKTSS